MRRHVERVRLWMVQTVAERKEQQLTVAQGQPHGMSAPNLLAKEMRNDVVVKIAENHFLCSCWKS